MNVSRLVPILIAAGVLYATSCGSSQNSLFDQGGAATAGTAGAGGGDASVVGGGAGSPGCPASAPTRCGADCVDTTQDSAHCGGCGKVCSAGLVCISSQCVTKPCASEADCDDGFACTIDTCEASGTCAHVAGPNQGSTACPVGQFCVVGKGCVASKACQSDGDCVDTDTCTQGEKCDPAQALCTWTLLDGDHDGHAPIACGGDDCDDQAGQSHAGAMELCDGLDNNCDGVLDDGATCPNAWASCQAGACVCQPDHACGQDCVDKNTSLAHCGQCFHACTPGASCSAGQCVCASGTPCPQGCVDLATDEYNCGACQHACPYGATCVAGACKCTGSQVVCNNQCTDTNVSSSHCGTCHHPCGSHEQCSYGTCVCTGTMCSGVCVDTYTDPSHCGSCTTTCGVGQPCVGGQCGTGGSSGGAGSGGSGVMLVPPSASCPAGKLKLFGTCFP